MEKESKSRALTVFDEVNRSEVIKAIQNLIKGKTPKEEIKERPVGGGRIAAYVNGYYMFRQFSLITAFRWTSECLEERTWPDKPPYQELGAKMKVTVRNKDGEEFSHTSWGAVDLKGKERLSHFDQWKAAYSDGIKKCLSYFGIANDVYGGRDLQFEGKEPPSEVEKKVGLEESKPISKQKVTPIDSDRAKFLQYIHSNKISLTDAMDILEVDDLDDVNDWKEALEKVKEGA